MNTANAFPRKRFFIEMFTRDISLSDCILDLIDNSIDGLIRSRDIQLGETLLEESEEIIINTLPIIKINYTEKHFSISDNCGGISYDLAKNEIFNFGHEHDYHSNNRNYQLGVYGIGMKRAIFKIGDYFKIESKSIESGFITEVESLKTWVQNDKRIEDWTFPIEKKEKDKIVKNAGTKITIKNLRKEVKLVLKDTAFSKRLSHEVAKAYALFLNKHVKVMINGINIEPVYIPFGTSDEISAGYKKLFIDEMNVTIYASVASKGEKGEWKADVAGWYVACNGRLVLTANKDELTGWGMGALPSFVSKFRGFVGLVIFQSSNPYLLPWTTTKRGLNQESPVYQKIKIEMQQISRPIISFLNKMYPTEASEDAPYRDIAKKVIDTSILKISKTTEKSFTVSSPRLTKVKTTTRIQYSVEKSEVEKVKKHLKDPRMTNTQIGLLSFNEYLKKEKLV